MDHIVQDIVHNLEYSAHCTLGGTGEFNHCEFVEGAACRQVMLGDMMKLQ